MIRAIAIVALVGALSGSANAQTNVQGNCNTVIGQTKGGVHITCSGVPPEVADHLSKLLSLLLGQKEQADEVTGKIERLYRSLSEMNRRSRAEHLSILQKISDRRRQCEEGEADLALRVERLDQPNTQVYVLSSIDNDSLAQLRSAIGVSGAPQFDAFQSARKALDAAVGQYSYAAASLSGIQSAVRSSPPNLPPAMAAMQRRQVADLRQKSTVAGRQTIETFSKLCRALKDLETACTSDTCTD